MIIKTINGCFGASTTINGVAIEKISKDSLVDIYNRLVYELECSDELISHIESLVDIFGTQNDITICDECGNWTYNVELELKDNNE